MAPVPQGFPFRLSDAELDRVLEDMMDPSSIPGFDNFNMLLPELKLALLREGLSERSAREARAAARTNLRVAYASLAVALAALVVSVVLALW